MTVAVRKYEGNSRPYTPSSAVTGGDVVVIGSMVCVAPVDIAANALGIVDIEGIFQVPCKEDDVVADGVVLYWDAADGEATVIADSGTNKVMGFATTASPDEATTVEVKLGRFVDTDT